MEAINGRHSFAVCESFNHDLAIRKFCPARMEQQNGEDEYYSEETVFNEFDLILSPCHDDVAASEVDQLVDSFINVDHHDHSPDQTHQNHFQDEMIMMDMFSSSGDVSGDVPMMIDVDEFETTNECMEDFGAVPSVDQGLHLVHSLLACAEAVGCRDTQLANSILNQISFSINPQADSLQRVSYCFALGLKSRLSLLHSANANGTFSNAAIARPSLIAAEERTEAFQLLYQTTPYIAFGFMAANEAISQAARDEDSIHVIDLGMEHTLQWPSFIRTLASRAQGPPKLRITGLINDQNSLEVEASMKSLTEDANSLGLSLEFDLISEPITPSLLTRENLKLREGEALFVNSIMHLHKFVKESRGSLKAILQAIKKLNPTLLTVVEQDANHNGPFFLGRFLESLHYYSAIFDSLEASLPRNSRQRMKIEKLHFAEEIRNIVAYEGCNRVERHERADQWRRQLGRAGFQIMGLKCMSQARMMLSVYGCDGYTLATEKGCLLLGWKGRPIMLASAWQLHNLLPPP
ncbi:GRAS family protein RAD1-like [Mercurialis annua]|uniref:GRAS family protein RAD1-like n=1 Tax=Mercurialis annua TaxID=3986 RepID=UPI00215FC331|nr:GRAS family protein RAD1-like [Mercurialis annua]